MTLFDMLYSGNALIKEHVSEKKRSKLRFY